MSQVNPERNLWMKCGFLALCVFSTSVFFRFFLSGPFTTKGERWWVSQSMFYCFFFFFLFLVWGPSEFVPLVYFLHSPFSSLMVWRMYYSWGGTAIRPEFSRGSFDGDLGRWMAERENSRKSWWESGRAGSEQRQQGWRDGEGRIRVVWPGSRAGRIWCSSREYHEGRWRCGCWLFPVWATPGCQGPEVA